MGPTSIQGRLVTHLARATAVAAACAAPAAADIVSYDLNAVVPANIDGLYVNVETAQTGSAATAVAGWDINPYAATGLSWFNATGTGMLRYPGTTTGSAASLAVGTEVGAGGSYGSGASTFGAAAGNWQLNAVNYFGFRFTAADGLTHYGWGSMLVGATASDRTLLKVAYESVANTPIVTGSEGGPPPPYDPCSASNPALATGSNSVWVNQSTAADLDLSAACGLVVHKANVVRFTAGSAGSYTFSTCAGTQDTRMALMSACSGGVTYACNDNCPSGVGSTLARTLAAGEQVFIAVGSASAGASLSSPLSISVVAPPPPPLADVTDPATGIRYLAVSATTWTLAEADAQARGGHLVSIGSAEENAFVLAQFGNLGGVDRRLWIGFSDTASEGSFAWSDGSPVTYTNWNPGEPNNSGGTEDWAEMLGSNGRWNDIADGGSGFPHVAVVELGPTAPPCPEDLSGDGAVDGVDLGVLLGSWGLPGAADLNADGFVDGIDLGLLLGNWGLCG
jgi:hypothetical protein